MIEIAVAVLDGRSLATVDEFDTLVNPMRDVGRSDIHGIRPAMVAAARLKIDDSTTRSLVEREIERTERGTFGQVVGLESLVRRNQ